MVHRFAVHAPTASEVSVVAQSWRTLTVSRDGHGRDDPAKRRWHGEAEAEEGDIYWFVVDGVGPLLDPDAMDVAITSDGPRSVIRTHWPKQPALGRHHDDPVVYELHVRGFARTFAGCIDTFHTSPTSESTSSS